MPAIGNGRTSPDIPGLGMSNLPSTTGEFIFEDDGSPSPLPNLENDFDDTPNLLEDNGTAAAVASTSLLSPMVTFATDPKTPTSTNGSGDSRSDSSSSKRTASTVSTKTTATSPDIAMNDAADVKTEWTMNDFINIDEEGLNSAEVNADSYVFGNGSNFDNTTGGSFSDLPVNIFTPSAGGFASLMNNGFGGGIAKAPLSPVATRAPGGFNQTSSVSLTQSIFEMNMDASREVSPMSQLIPSQDSSPSAFPYSPPPAAHSFNFGNSDFHPQWPGAVNLDYGSQLQQNGAAMHVPGTISGSMATPSMFPQLLYGPGPYSLHVYPIPAKSRVETQIPIKLTMTTLPVGIKKLHLPTHTISKPKLLAKPTPEPSKDTLELYTVLVCSSAMQNAELKDKALQRARTVAMAGRKATAAPESDQDEIKPQDGGDVNICAGCITRERKRAGRKKVKKLEDEQLWLKDENRRVIVFNTQEVKEWQQVQPDEHALSGTGFHVDIPMRVACYCRHHGEKMGFQVIFTVTDHTGQVIAQSMSPSIMITDDHKTHVGPAPAPGASADTAQAPGQQPNSDTALTPPAGPFRASHSASDLQAAKRASVSRSATATSPGGLVRSPGTSTVPTPRNLSRPASPTGFAGPSTKKRKSSGTVKVPSGLAMTRLETGKAQPAGPQASQSTQSASTTSPFSPSMTNFPTVNELTPVPINGLPHGLPNGLPLAIPGSSRQLPFAPGPTSPSSNEQQGLFGSGTANAGAHIDPMTLASIYSTPASGHPSRAPSPTSGLRANALLQQNGFAQAVAGSLSAFHGLPVAVNSLAAPPPCMIHKIIPAEGPKSGGIEVTVLGGGFYQGLEVMFGDVKATTTTFWGETSLVCLLPPSAIAGPVRVSFKHQLAQPTPPQIQRQQPMFNYVDDDEQQLMRTALAVLAAKMNGSFEDTRVIARRIIGDSGMPWSSSSSGGASGGASGPFNGYAMDFESQLIKILDCIDLSDSEFKPRYNLRRSTGQTMLHLACSLGLYRFVAGLLARGANPDPRDKGGYTPLHMAALNDHPEIVKRLISCGADPTIRTLSGLNASDMATSVAVLNAIKRVSSGSIHSRASSMTSMKSIWESPSAQMSPEQSSREELGSGEESPEYTSGDFESEDDDPDGDDDWLSMRRSSVHESRVQEIAVIDEPHGGLASPSAAMAAWKEQFTTQIKEQFTAQVQQFQQAMALHFQNFPQFPALPQMPNMPPLPEYQVAMQRLASMVPNIGSFRPGSAGGPDVPPLEGRWWDLSSLMSGNLPPPAYEDIFPKDQERLEKKQGSAAQAAAEAEADSKCAMLYDGATSTSTSETAVPSSSVCETAQQLPALLQIGRKNAITKEQQENLRRAHAERMKRLSRDRNLFFIWIPLLVIVLCAMLYNRFPGLFVAAASFIMSLFGWVSARSRGCEACG